MKPTLTIITTLVTTLIAAASLHAAPDILIADFEGRNYGDWKIEGEAFGNAPAHGKIGGQMPVTGFRGRGLVNSFLGGDGATGKLTSPPFEIGRKHITFLIGGGGYPGETCMNLIVDGKATRTAFGPNTAPGGSEALAPFAWDVTEFMGKKASIVIVDERKGGWGHITVDHIQQVDEKGTLPLANAAPPRIEITRTLKLTAAFLQLPLANRANVEEPGVGRFTIEDASGKVLRFMHLKFPAADAKPDYWYSADVREFAGQTVTLRFKSHGAEVLNRLKLEDTEIIDPKAYEGPHRPRFHFSPRIGWMNDVNGTYYLDGLYHFFYQANPTTTASSTGFDMHWGHSVSKDLIHWEELPIAVFPDHTGNCYSGTSIVVKQPIPGLLEKVPSPAMFFAATAPFSQHLATTADGGRTWQRFAGNPVVPNIGNGDRDPKVVWHAESKTYAMVLFTEKEGRRYVILNSKDLIKWDIVGELPGWYECPEFFPIKSAITGQTSWLLYGSYSTPKGHPRPFSNNSAYVLGDFDGRTFTPRTEPRAAHLGPNFYGALIFDNAPNDRRIMMGWTRGTSFPGEPFNQSASLPLEMKLKAINGQDTLTFEPAAEINALHAETLINEKALNEEAARAKLSKLTKEQQLDVLITLPASESFILRVRALTFQYEASTRTLTQGNVKTTLHPTDQLSLRVLIDRGVVESFWNAGEAAFCHASLHTDNGPALEVTGTTSALTELRVHQLSKIW